MGATATIASAATEIAIAARAATGWLFGPSSPILVLADRRWRAFVRRQPRSDKLHIGQASVDAMQDSVWKPDVTVAAVVERDGRYLFIEERVRGELLLNQPAGHLEPDESLLAAVRRETLEESAWEIEPTGLVGIYQWTSPRTGMAFLRFAFAARPLAHHRDRALDIGIERALWLSADELARHPVPTRSPLVAQCLADHRAGSHHCASLLRQIDSRPAWAAMAHSVPPTGSGG